MGGRGGHHLGGRFAFTLKRSKMISLAPALSPWSLLRSTLLRERAHPCAPPPENSLEEAALER